MDFKGKRVLLRADLNVPVQDGKVTDATRIERIVPTIREIIKVGRQGDPDQPFRPAQGQGRQGVFARAGGAGGGRGDRASGRVHRHRLGRCAARPRQAIDDAPDGSILVLENTRFHAGRGRERSGAGQAAWRRSATSTSTTRSRRRIARMPRPRVSRICCRRRRGSRCRPSSRRSRRGSGNPKKPVIAVVGGAKVSTKIDLLQNLVDQGRCAGDRRGDGQHVPPRRGDRRRQVAGRTGHGRHRQRHSRQGREGQLRDHRAGRRAWWRGSSRPTRRTRTTGSTRWTPRA